MADGTLRGAGAIDSLMSGTSNSKGVWLAGGQDGFVVFSANGHTFTRNPITEATE